eukprot:TRINITY_DN15215_c0_g1_i1.p1 TRINITY_DN15215_c0_g1~~TRINITY_DN15215_c0_g1_i1.p1  ORF type:complete len:901 (+),score=163.69 TRINITY_DN15215_c0_g1_i1:204-2906(+)
MVQRPVAGSQAWQKPSSDVRRGNAASSTGPEMAAGAVKRRPSQPVRPGATGARNRAGSGSAGRPRERTLGSVVEKRLSAGSQGNAVETRLSAARQGSAVEKRLSAASQGSAVEKRLSAASQGSAVEKRLSAASQGTHGEAASQGIAVERRVSGASQGCDTGTGIRLRPAWKPPGGPLLDSLKQHMDFSRSLSLSLSLSRGSSVTGGTSSAVVTPRGQNAVALTPGEMLPLPPGPKDEATCLRSRCDSDLSPANSYIVADANGKVSPSAGGAALQAVPSFGSSASEQPVAESVARPPADSPIGPATPIADRALERSQKLLEKLSELGLLTDPPAASTRGDCETSPAAPMTPLLNITPDVIRNAQEKEVTALIATLANLWERFQALQKEHAKENGTSPDVSKSLFEALSADCGAGVEDRPAEEDDALATTSQLIRLEASLAAALTQSTTATSSSGRENGKGVGSVGVQTCGAVAPMFNQQSSPALVHRTVYRQSSAPTSWRACAQSQIQQQPLLPSRSLPSSPRNSPKQGHRSTLGCSQERQPRASSPPALAGASQQLARPHPQPQLLSEARPGGTIWVPQRHPSGVVIPELPIGMAASTMTGGPAVLSMRSRSPSVASPRGFVKDASFAGMSVATAAESDGSASLPLGNSTCSMLTGNTSSILRCGCGPIAPSPSFPAGRVGANGVVSAVPPIIRGASFMSSRSVLQDSSFLSPTPAPPDSARQVIIATTSAPLENQAPQASPRQAYRMVSAPKAADHRQYLSTSGQTAAQDAASAGRQPRVSVPQLQLSQPQTSEVVRQQSASTASSAQYVWETVAVTQVYQRLRVVNDGGPQSARGPAPVQCLPGNGPAPQMFPHAASMLPPAPLPGGPGPVVPSLASMPTGVQPVQMVSSPWAPSPRF